MFASAGCEFHARFGNQGNRPGTSGTMTTAQAHASNQHDVGDVRAAAHQEGVKSLRDLAFASYMADGGTLTPEILNRTWPARADRVCILNRTWRSLSLPMWLAARRLIPQAPTTPADIELAVKFGNTVHAHWETDVALLLRAIRLATLFNPVLAHKLRVTFFKNNPTAFPYCSSSGSISKHAAMHESHFHYMRNRGSKYREPRDSSADLGLDIAWPGKGPAM